MDIESIKQNLFGCGILPDNKVKKNYERLRKLTSHEQKVSTIFDNNDARKAATILHLDRLMEGQYENWKYVVDVKTVATDKQFNLEHNIDMVIRLFQHKKIMGTSYLPFYEHYYIFGANANGIMPQTVDNLTLESVTKVVQDQTWLNWFGPVKQHFVERAPLPMAVFVLNSFPEAARPLLQLAHQWTKHHLHNYKNPLTIGCIALPYMFGKYACPFCLHIAEEDPMVSHIATCLLSHSGITKINPASRYSSQFINNYYKAIIGTKNGLEVVDARDYKTVGFMSPYTTWCNFTMNLLYPISVNSLNTIFTKHDDQKDRTVACFYSDDGAKVKIPCFACDFSYLLDRPCALSLKFEGRNADCIVCKKPGGKIFRSVQELIAVTLGVAVPEIVPMEEEQVQDRTLIKNVVENVIHEYSPNQPNGLSQQKKRKLLSSTRGLQILTIAALRKKDIRGLFNAENAKACSSMMASLGVNSNRQYGLPKRKWVGKGTHKRKKPKRICYIQSYQRTKSKYPMAKLFRLCSTRNPIQRRVEISKWMESQYRRLGVEFVRDTHLVESGTIGFE